MHDNRIGSEHSTMNNNENPIYYASFFNRVVAALIDGVILLPVSSVAMMNLVDWKNFPLFILTAVITLCYKPVMEGIYGATLGKMAIKLKLVDERLNPISFDQSMARNILFILSSIGGIITAYILFQTPDLSLADIYGEEAVDRQDLGSIIQSICSILLFVSVLSVIFDRQRQALHDKFGRSFCIIHFGS